MLVRITASKKIFMKSGDNEKIAVLILRFLYEESDAGHSVKMDDIIRMLEKNEIEANRKTIGKYINAFREAGIPVHMDRKNHRYGYYVNHLFSATEVMFLSDAADTSSALSPKASKELKAKLRSLVSAAEAENIPSCAAPVVKTDNDHVLKTIGVLMEAIRLVRPVEFLYYDIFFTNTKREKKYRKERQTYCLVPYAVVLNDGKYYCIFRDDRHESFALYRADKMEAAVMKDGEAERVPFNAQSFLRSSFGMYHGDADTVTLRAERSLSSVLFDRFGENGMIITGHDENTFTCSIRTAVTPTLISFLIQFTGRITVLGPETLIAEFRKIAETLRDTYGNEEK